MFCREIICDSKTKIRKKAITDLRTFFESEDSFFIHYSCESFDKDPSLSSRITSIALCYLKNRQIKQFSIPKTHESKKDHKDKNIEDIYDKLEEEMLSEFFDFLDKERPKFFMHWNMRDGIYGFEAIIHRYKVLTNKNDNNIYNLVSIKNRIDLSESLINIYGQDYIDHNRLTKLSEKNQLSMKNFLSGKEEADAFESKEYTKLAMSTARKVKCIADIFDLTIKGKLKTNANFADRYGLYKIKTFVSYVKSHPFYAFIGIIGAVAGLVTTLWRIF